MAISKPIVTASVKDSKLAKTYMNQMKITMESLNKSRSVERDNVNRAYGII